MPYSAKAIANYFIKKSIQEDDCTLNLMKLLKLIYIAHGFHLALHDKPLINEEIQAWQYGPVISNIYHAFKHFGMDLISEITTDVKFNEKGRMVLYKYDDAFPEDAKKILDKVWNDYKKHTGLDLSSWSHQKDSPWDKVWNEEGAKNYYNYPISNNLIKGYFTKQIEQGRKNGQRQTSNN